MKLRDYQERACVATMDAFEDNQFVLVVLATGLGKTVIAAHDAQHFKPKGRILLLAHSEELIRHPR